jgi:hypothetical protein
MENEPDQGFDDRWTAPNRRLHQHPHRLGFQDCRFERLIWIRSLKQEMSYHLVLDQEV